jgi:LytS/YehU family sensor histidine kinase
MEAACCNGIILINKKSSLRRYFILYHIFFWSILYILWIYFFQNHAFSFTRTLTVQFCYLSFVAADYYFIVYFLLDRVLYKKGYFLFILSAIGIIAVSSVLRSALAVFMNAHFFMRGKEQPPLNEILLSSFVNIFIWVLILVAAKLIWDKIQNQRYTQSVEKERAIAELNFLKAQVNPHFLFNSLNSVYGYIDRNNKTARNLLLQFSEMLRYQLYECNADRVPISKEITYLRNYALLQQHRKEESLIVQFNTDDDWGGSEIAPLLLIVFVENAFKYVSNFEDRENKIIISLHHTMNKVELSVFNTTENSRKNSSGGIGLTNVKRRLDILYPQKHDLIIRQGNDSFSVQLQIDLT